jgi:outer membrane protein assembly factor BamB
MATLEVHHGQGRVQFVELTRDHPLLFGTAASCDLVLEGPGIMPVHGRIRWKSKRFKVEASPDAEFVLVNGHRMSAGSLGQGDEVAFGSCRMFLLRVEEDPASLEVRPVASAGRAAPRQPAPPPRAEAWRGGGPAPQGAARGRGESRREDEREPATAEFVRDMRSGAIGSRGYDVARPAATKAPRGPSWLARMARGFRGFHGPAPGRERIATSPLVLGLAVALCVLAAMGFWLRAVISATVASKTFSRGAENFDNGDYRTAMRDFDAFIAANPQDSRAGKARVLRALANVRQYISPSGSTWSTALEAAQEMFEQTGREPEFRDERMSLAEVVIRIGEGLADRARQNADAKTLSEAESAVPLHARIAGEPAVALLNRSRLPAKLAEARAAVRKAQVRARGLAAIDKALADGSASGVYDARDDLVAEYADLAQDRELIARITAANELVRKAVKVDTTRRPAERTARPALLGPATTAVTRSRRDLPSAPVGPESIVYALGDGAAYALDAATGAPLWQVPLGLASPFVPQPIPGDGTVLAFDAVTNDLLRLDAPTGSLRWRLALGERVVDPPLVVGNQLAQVLPSGKLVMVALESGEVLATINLGRPLARMPARDESGRHLYVAGRQDCVFILTRDPLGCSAVDYLGHADGSIPCAPTRLGQYMIISENDTLSDSRWHVLAVDDDGARVHPVQKIKVAGWTWQPPASSGPFVWATGDKAGLEAFVAGDDRKAPFRSVARLTSDARPSGPAFALARSERELWAASGHAGKFVLDPERGSIEPRSAFPVPGPALGPIQSAANTLVFTYQDQETGGVACWGIEPESGSIVWKTKLSAPWPTALVPTADSTALATIGFDGKEVVISQQQIARGGFVTLPVPRPGDFTLPGGRSLRVERDGKSVRVVAPLPHSKSLWVEDSTRRGGWREVGLAAAPAVDPCAWAGAVLIPGSDGRFYLVDPVTGFPRAEPYVPQFDRDRQGIWLAPALIDERTVVVANDVGRVRRLGLKTGGIPRLAAEAETTLDRRIASDPASTGGAVLVVTDDRRIRSLAVRDLSPVGAWPMDAPLSGRPVGLDDLGLVMDRAGGVTAFGRDGQRAWSIKLGAEVVGIPRVSGRSILFLTSTGVVHVRARNDGAASESKELGILADSGLLPPLASQIILAITPGTIRTLAMDKTRAAKP